MQKNNVDAQKLAKIPHTKTCKLQCRSALNLMLQVIEPDEAAMAVRQHLVYDINLDSYCTHHMMPCFSLEEPQKYEVDIMVGNREKLRSTHKGIMRLGTCF